MKAIVPRPIEEYATAHTTSHSALLEELEEYTLANCTHPQMLIGRLEGALLRMLVCISDARRILEVGLFTGYSALTMAEVLPQNGELISCEMNTESAQIAQSFFDRSPHGHKISVRLGSALDTIKTLDPKTPFDLIFIDADKENYSAYYEATLPLLKTGGLLLADNTLWSGNVLKPQAESDRALVAFNDRVQQDDRVENVLLTVRDGLTLIKKM
jgi:caffeoyl-CoA O-methyltransferase